MADVSSLERKVRLAAQRRAGRAVDVCLRQTRNDAPFRTGELKRSGRALPIRQRGNSYVTGISFTAPQAVWTEKGTRAHTITPKGSGYPLKFYWAKMGAVVRYMKVRHPGSRKYRGWFSKPMARRWRNALKSVSGV